MQVKLSYKLFFTFWVTCLVIVALMVVIMQSYTSRSFHIYVNKVELEQMNALVAGLTAEYQKHHGWEWLRDNPVAWRKLIRPKPTGLAGPEENPGQLHPPPPPPFPPPFNREGRPLPFPPPPGGRPPPGVDPLKIGIRLSLFDAHQQPVFGQAQSTQDHTLKPIVIAGKTVGWLGIKQPGGLRNPMDVEYAKQQTKAFYLIGASILFLVTIIAFFLSRYLTAPIQRLTAGTRALAAHKYDTRIDVRSRDELGQLAADFNAMAEAIEKFEQQRHQWISDISHEIRTPLAVLQGEVEAMQDGILPLSRKALDSLHDEIRYINKIVNDLHDISLAESDLLSIKREPVDPLLILQETLRSFRTRFKQRHLEIQTDLGAGEPVFITGDADRLRQIFANLLENTLRYADSPGILQVWSELRDSMLFLHFVDSGPGVPPAAVPRLFDRLYRVDRSRTRTQGGSGLGLAICKSMVEAFEGGITASNSPAGGLAIEIRLPLRST